MEHCCKNCIYWNYTNRFSTKETCRRFPPSFRDKVKQYADSIQYDAKYYIWPVTDHDDWCGEFQLIIRSDKSLTNNNDMIQ